MFHLPYDACEIEYGTQSECLHGGTAGEIISFIADFACQFMAFLA